MKGKEEIVIKEKPHKEKKEKVKKRVRKAVSKIPLIARHNTYLHGLLDPFNVHGTQVPDFACTPSCTFSAIYRNTLGVGTGGCCGMVMGQSLTGTYPNFTTYGGLVPYNTGTVANAYSTGFLLANSFTATGGLIVAAPTPVRITNFDATSAAIPNAFARVRLASFGIRITYVGSALNAQGKITVAFAPVGTLTNNLANSTLTLAMISQLPHSSVYSVPKDGGAVVLWRPTDFEDQNYAQVGVSTPAYPPTGPLPTGIADCEIYVIVDGAVTNQTFFVEAVWNFEAIPTNNTMNFFSPSVSKADPIALSSAANLLEELPSTAVAPPKVTEAELKHESEVVHHENNEETFIDKLIEYGPKLGSMAISGIKTITPLVSTLLAAL